MKKEDKKWPSEKELKIHQLRRWKYSSTRAKMQWLEEALRFAKLKKF